MTMMQGPLATSEIISYGQAIGVGQGDDLDRFLSLVRSMDMVFMEHQRIEMQREQAAKKGLK